MSKAIRVFDAIDTVNHKIGTFLCYFLLVLIAIQDFEVMMRYVFNNPTSWAWDINGMIFTGIAMIAGAYALRHDMHVRLDIFFRNFSPKKKAMVELLSFPFLFIALCVVLWQGIDMAWWSYSTGERAYSHLAPIQWPVKTCLPIAALLMLVQSISRYGRIFLKLKHPEMDEQKEVNP